MNLRVADPLRVFKGSEVLVFSSAFLRFHRNEFNLDPCVEGMGDSGEFTECDPPSAGGPAFDLEFAGALPFVVGRAGLLT